MSKLYKEEEIKQNNKSIFVSLGNYCITGVLLKEEYKIKIESHPFDWMVSCIENINHILEDNFKEFTNKENLEQIDSKTKNKFYFDNTNKLFQDLIVDHQHHNLLNENDYEYILRCVERFKTLETRYKKINFIMFLPLFINNSKLNLEEVYKLDSNLKKYFNNFNLLIFPLENYVINEENTLKLNENTYIINFKTKIIKGKYGMNYLDNNGINNLKIILDKFM